MRIITISNLYPRPDQPTRAMFNFQLFREMGRMVTGYQLLVVGETDNQQQIANNHYLNICLVPEWRVWRWPEIRRWTSSEGETLDRRQCGRGAPRRDSDLGSQSPGTIAAAERASHIEDENSRTTIYLPVFYLPVIGRSINWWFYYRALRGRVNRSLLSVAGNTNNQQPLTNNRENGAQCAVLASWLYPDAVAVARLAKDLGAPVWLRVHGTDRYHLKNRRRRRLILEAVDYAQGVICNARAVADDLVKWGIPAAKIHIIPNGVDTSLFRVRNKEELLVDGYLLSVTGNNQQPITDNSSASGGTLLFVGNLVPIKGPDLLLRAFAALGETADHRPETIDLYAGSVQLKSDVYGLRSKVSSSPPHLLLIGSGPMRAQLERLAQELGIADRVQFLGNRPHHEIARWMNVADVLCLASHSEGMPNVVLEARASGLPVVTTPAGAVPELPLDRDYFLVVKSCTPEDLATGLRDMLSRHLTKRCPDPAIPTWGQAAVMMLELMG